MKERMICNRCPVRDSCTALCADMEAYLAARGNSIVSKRSVHPQGDVSADLVGSPSDPETDLLIEERQNEIDEKLADFIERFLTQRPFKPKGGVRRKRIMRRALELHFLEGFSPVRVAELLGEEYAEFAGRLPGQRSLPYARVVTHQRGGNIVSRWCAEFREWVARDSMSAAIKAVLQTGSFDPYYKML